MTAITYSNRALKGMAGRDLAGAIARLEREAAFRPLGPAEAARLRQLTAERDRREQRQKGAA